MLSRNDICLCGSEKKYKKCCIDKKVAISEDIEFLPFDEDLSVPLSESLSKLSKMKNVELENFFENALDKKEIKCLGCSKASYETLIADTGSMYFECLECNDSFLAFTINNFISEVHDVDMSGIREEDDDNIIYDDIEEEGFTLEDLNDDIEDLFGLDISYLYPLVNHTLMTKDTDFAILDLNGEHKIVGDEVMFTYEVFDGEVETLSLGRVEDFDKQQINDLDKLKSIFVSNGDDGYIMSVDSSEYDSEEEIEEALHGLAMIDYFKHKGINTKEDALDFIMEAECSLISFLNQL